MADDKIRPILSMYEKAVQDALRKAGQAALKDARKLAPVDDGDLRKSGRVIVDDLTVQVSFTGIYAIRQHEDLDYQHPGGGQAKFLEQAVQNVSPLQIIAAEMRKALDG